VKFFAIILSILFFTLAVVPCCANDKCNDDLKTEQTHNKNSDSPKTPCSPFVACTCCPGVCIASSIGLVVVPVTLVVKTFTLFDQSIISFYTATIWQPPKIVC
jgi:hypothetical protein